MTDARQRVPGTDRVLSDPGVAEAAHHLGHELVKRTVHRTQQRARTGEIDPGEVVTATLRALPSSTHSIRRVLNATGVLLHTNLGRAPLSEAAVRALADAAGNTDVELDLNTGRRGARGTSATAALLETVPRAEAAHIVNNGAAALALAATVLAQGKEIVLARGEMVEIGDGFRIPELLATTGARLREVGTTNRVNITDYREAIGPDTGFVLKVHPSNFLISGFTSSVPVAELAGLDAPLVVDIGSGLLRPEPVLPHEPDATTVLTEGADLVTASGDKLLGGPQAGLLLGNRELLRSLRRHPLFRALRVDKLTLAALEATLRGPDTPTARALHQDPRTLHHRAEELATEIRASGGDARVRTTSARVGGGGAPGVDLASAAVCVPAGMAARLRSGDPPVLGRVEDGHYVLDLFAVTPDQDSVLLRAVTEAVD